MKVHTVIFIFVSILFLNGCSKVRESAGVARKSIDEFQVIENPPLIIPPDFNLLPPNQLELKNIENIERDLVQEILFGLDKDKLKNENQLSTMNQILMKAEAFNISNDIRDEIDREFAKEIKTDGIFQVQWENEIEVLDAIKESERIRNNNFDGKSLSDGKILIKKEVKKNKKKKRFFFF